METLKFSLVLAKQEVILVDENKVEQVCTINELPGPDLETYMDTSKDRMNIEMSDSGKLKVTGLKSFKGTYESLLSLCLRDASGNVVPVESIRKYPATVQKQLFEIAQTINGLNEKGQDELKKV